MISARQVGHELAKENARIVPQVSETLRRIAEEKKVHIFNIYPVSWRKSLGSLGTFTIPACADNGSQRPEDWAPYSKALIVPGLVFESFDMGTKHLSMAHWDGMDVAKDILGLTDGLAANSLERWGVFIAAGATPTKEELLQAKKRLSATMAEALQEGDRKWRGSDKERKELSDYHKRAAQYLNQKREWDSLAAEQVSCKFCGEPIKPNLIKCPQCREILDHQRWLEAQPEQILKAAQQHAAPVKPPVNSK